MGSQLAVASDPLNALTLEGVVVGGDLSALSCEQRLEWYMHRCEAAGLDPRTQPFQYLLLKGKLTLYATKSASDQLALKHRLRVEVLDQAFDRQDNLLSACCRVSFPDGRTVDDVAFLFVGKLAGEDLANARMKVVTKAKRRTILSACGLGAVADESEIDSIRDAQRVEVGPDGSIRAIGRQGSRRDQLAIEQSARSTELPSTRQAVNETFAPKASEGSTGRYPSKERHNLPAQRINATGMDPRMWANIPADEVAFLNAEIARECEASGLDPFVPIKADEVVNPLVMALLKALPDEANLPSLFYSEQNGKRFPRGVGERVAGLGRFYLDPDWREWLREILGRVLTRKRRDALDRIDHEVHGDGAILDALEDSQEPATAPEDENQEAELVGAGVAPAREREPGEEG